MRTRTIHSSTGSLALLLVLLSSSYGLVHNNPSSSSSSSSSPPSSTTTNVAAHNNNNNNYYNYCSRALGLDADRLQRTVSAGRVYQQHDFLSPHQIDALLQEIQDLQRQGAFRPSGLSNTGRLPNQQQFGTADRTVTVVPWWQNAVAGAYETVPESIGTVAVQLMDLRVALADILQRPTVRGSDSDTLIMAHECYYSVSLPGSFLPRHMDERHEELKGIKGWLLSSRRSLSWLVYLSDEGWNLEDNGGALRSFPQKATVTSASPSVSSSTASSTLSTSQHEENLQVGWLTPSSHDGHSRPVYMDSWYQLPGATTNFEPHCVLYTVNVDNDNDSSNGTNKKGRRELLTQPWLNDALQGMTASEFILGWGAKGTAADASPGLFLRTRDARQFNLLEDRAAWDAGKDPAGSHVEDISPVRGSLVVFDSVLVPHQVQAIIKGRRVALAGWFHETTQKFPDELYS